MVKSAAAAGLSAQVPVVTRSAKSNANAAATRPGRVKLVVVLAMCVAEPSGGCMCVLFLVFGNEEPHTVNGGRSYLPKSDARGPPFGGARSSLDLTEAHPSNQRIVRQ